MGRYRNIKGSRMKAKYNIGDIFVVPHFNGHNLPAVMTIIQCDKRKVFPTFKYLVHCSDDGIGDLIVYQEDLDHYIKSGEYVYYKVRK